MCKEKIVKPGMCCTCPKPFERDHGHWGVCMCVRALARHAFSAADAAGRCPKHLEMSEDQKDCIERVSKVRFSFAIETEVS
jgi:hypothetical protein